MKFRCPYQIYNSINISARDTSLTIILPEKNKTFLYIAAQIWNSIHKRIVKSDSGLETSVNLVKIRAKTLILECQAVEERDHWTDKNFQLTHVKSSQEIACPAKFIHKSLDSTTGTLIDIVS